MDTLRRRGGEKRVLRLVPTETATLDGVIDASEGWFDPSEGDDADQSDVLEAAQGHVQTEDALPLGRETSESFRRFWPA